MSELLTIAATIIVIIGQLFAYFDRRRVARNNQLTEPIVIELSITVDPTLVKQPTITAYAKQRPVTQ